MCFHPYSILKVISVKLHYICAELLFICVYCLVIRVRLDTSNMSNDENVQSSVYKIIVYLQLGKMKS